MPLNSSPRSSDFLGLGIAPNLLDALKRLKFATPTPIQERTIPIAIQGKDVVGVAQTGTGKTLAFAIPMLQQLSAKKGIGLILLPTRELALQVEETFQKIGVSFGLRTALIIGGAAMDRQVRALKKNPHVIIATPGRLIDHLNQKIVSLQSVTILVLDEADRMLDMGFAPQIREILSKVPRERQTMLFSATMPEEIARIAVSHMKLPIRIEVARAGSTVKGVQQEFVIIKKEDKLRLLEKLLSEHVGIVLVFSRTKHGAKKISWAVKQMGHTSAELHSDKSLAQRRHALDGFKSGQYRVLVATDIAARGIDVTGIELVINYDLPDQAEDYVHRIGRTGRAGKLGKAISFATPDQRRDIMQIERLVQLKIPLSHAKELPSQREFKSLQTPVGGDRRSFPRRSSSGASPAWQDSRPRRRRFTGHGKAYGNR